VRAYLQEVSFMHDGHEYTVEMDCDPDLVKPRLVVILDEEGNPVRQWERDGKYLSMSETPRWQGLHKSAWDAFDAHCEKAYNRRQERLMEDPPESHESIHARERVMKDGYR
jgi:hypothetical protein